jgi:hypothetical protein
MQPDVSRSVRARVSATACILAVSTACETKPLQKEASPPTAGVTWVAAGMQHCHALTPTPRQTVIAACDTGIIETDASGKSHTLHPTLSHDVSLNAGRLWVKLPDMLLWGDLPRAGTIFASTKRIKLGTIDDLVSTPDGWSVVATPGTFVRVSPDGTINRFRKVPVPIEKLSLGGPDATGAPEILALAKDAVYAVEKKQFRMVLGGLVDLRAAVTLADGRLVVASGRPTSIGVLQDGSFRHTSTVIEGLTDLTTLSTGSGEELWFTTRDGSVGRAPIP